jgi:actin-related protein 3
MVDARIMHSQITSQMNMSNEQQITAKQIEVNVVSHKKQRYAVWFGGSLLADTVKFMVNLAWFLLILSHQSAI